MMQNEPTNLLEDTINSIDSINRAEAPPFFSRRLSVKLKNNQHINEMPTQKYLYIMATSLFLLLFMNTMILKQQPQKNEKAIDITSHKESFSDLYILNDNSTYYYDDNKKK